jgi:hypothetical protein
MEDEKSIIKRINGFITNISNALESKRENIKAGANVKSDDRISGWMRSLEQDMAAYSKICNESHDVELRAQFSETSKRYKKLATETQTIVDKYEIKQLYSEKPPQTEDNTSDKQKLLLKQETKLKSQDENLEELNNGIEEFKSIQQNIGVENKKHGVILDNMGQGMDSNTTSLLTLNHKIKRMISNSSSCSLWMIVTVEVIILIVLLII